MPAAELPLGEFQCSFMTLVTGKATSYTSHSLLLCEPLGAGLVTRCEHPTAALMRIRQVSASPYFMLGLRRLTRWMILSP